MNEPITKVREHEQVRFINLDRVNVGNNDEHVACEIRSQDVLIPGNSQIQLAVNHAVIPSLSIPFFKCGIYDPVSNPHVGDVLFGMRLKTKVQQPDLAYRHVYYDYKHTSEQKDYLVYNIEYFLESVNESLEYLVKLINEGAVTSGEYPKVHFVKSTGLFELHIPKHGDYDNFELYCNRFTYGLFFAGMPMFETLSEDHTPWRFIPVNPTEIAGSPPTNVYTSFESTLSNWNHYESVLFQTTGDMLIVPETSSYGLAATNMTILTTINIAGLNLKNGHITYLPNEMRFCNVYASSDCYAVGIKLYLRARSGEVIPLKQSFGSHFTAKLCIRQN